MKVKILCGLLAAAGLLLPPCAHAVQSGAGAVSLTTSPSQSFDGLDSGTVPSSVLPDGWYLSETGTGAAADGQYVGSDGDSNGGNVYSYGNNGSNERAMGSITSGKVKPIIGAKLLNDTGLTLVDLAVSYAGEQWRRGNSNQTDALQLQYSSDATSLTDGTWNTVTGLTFDSPITGAPHDTKLDGNASANRRAISGTIQGINLANNGTVWLRWFDADASGNDDGLAIDDVVFGQPVDNPPTLASSFPADGDTDFPSNGSLIFTFSEAVSVSGNWFSLVCGTSGSLGPSDANITGGPTTWYVDLSNDLSIGEGCSLNFVSASILDQDGTADALVDPGTIDFSVIAPPPNDPPTLVSTVPAQAATNFPAAGDLKAVFSEPVTLDAGAFALSCTASTGIVLTPASGDGITWTINTGTALVAGDSCQFSLLATAIHDLEGAELVAGAVISFNVLDAGNVGAYYQNVNLSSPEQLRCSLHAIIKGHTVYPYSGSGTSSWSILEIAQEDPNNSSRIIDVYRNRSYAKGSDRAGQGGGITYNREHTWPNSLGFASSGLAAYTDTHMLWLSDTQQNSDRGNKPYANCPQANGCSELQTEVNGGVGGTGQSNWVKTPDGSNGSFEVWNHRKGEMARAMFYMAIRYEGISAEDGHDGDVPDLELTDTRSLITNTSNTAAKAYMGLLSDLLSWHAGDAPDTEEVVRNGVIQSFQNNRNPFVDHPEWVSQALFTSSQPADCTLNTEAPTATADTYATAVDAPLTVNAPGVLGNDNDPEGAPMTASVVSAASHGSVMLGGSGGFTYTPNAGYCGSDSFTYKASDGVRDSAPATVAIEVGSNCGGPTWNGFSDGFEGP